MGSNDADLEACFQIAMDKYADMVYRVAVNQMKNTADAEDIFQEVFIRWMQHRKEFESEQHEKAWLIRVTINLCKNALTSSWRKRTEQFDEKLENTLSYEDTVEEGSDVLQAIEKLPEKYRVVIHLFYYEELSIAEIGQVLQEKESTIRTQLTRARRKLKHMLKGVEVLC